MKAASLLSLLALTLTACGSASTAPDAGTSDTDAGVPDAGVAAGMNGCTTEAYVDKSTGTASSRMIMINGGGHFDYPCMTINAGQGVEFMWSFSNYKLMPGLAPSHSGDQAGTEPTPIESHNTGSIYTVTFPNAGFYPFYVDGHDATLLGVVQVR